MPPWPRRKAQANQRSDQGGDEGRKDRGVVLGGLRDKGLELQREALQRAEGLRTVFEELSSLSARQAAEKLNADGVPTPNRGKWHAAQVIRVRARLK
jgi:hypothetical protein